MARILCIEDEPQLLLLYRRVLEELGHQVLTAENGRDGLLLLAGGQGVALVITDMLMPEMDGIEFLREVRSRGWMIPVIAVTGGGAHSHGPSLLSMAMALGAVAALSKPFTPRRLGELVERLLGESPDAG